MKMLRRLALATPALLVLVGSGPCNPGPGLIRGPYLQLSTSSSIVVRWRTGEPADSRVRYGSSPTSLGSVVDDPAVVAEHVVTLTNLAPDTTYYYSVGSTTETLAGADPDHFFTTSPIAGTDKPTRIWVIGDAGTKSPLQDLVRDAYLDYTGSRHTDLWLMLGDNAYSSGTDDEFQLAVFNKYQELLRSSVVWPTIGNHDAGSADSATQTGPYYDIFSMPRNAEAGGLPTGTEAYYSFDYGNIHFICLDSQETDRSPSGAMMTWLQADAAATAQDWTIAYWHHPPYSKGSHDSDTEGQLIEMRQNALPILEDLGVDLVLTGHSHSYERSFLLDEHYGHSSTLVPSMIKDGGSGDPTGDGEYQKPSAGPAAHEGAVYAVAGSSGQISGGDLDHPAMYASLNQLGSMVLDVTGNQLDAVFLSSAGDVTDRFSIHKGP